DRCDDELRLPIAIPARKACARPWGRNAYFAQRLAATGGATTERYHFPGDGPQCSEAEFQHRRLLFQRPLLHRSFDPFTSSSWNATFRRWKHVYTHAEPAAHAVRR